MGDEYSPSSHLLRGKIRIGGYITSHEQKEAVAFTFGGLCCEMDCAAIAQVCCLNEARYVMPFLLQV